MTELKIYRSAGKTINLIFIALGFVLLGLSFLSDPGFDSKSIWIAYACLKFFGGGLIIFVFQLFDYKALIVLNNQGIMIDRKKDLFLKWEQIRDTEIVDINGQNFITFEMTEDFNEKESTLEKWIRVLTNTGRYNLLLSNTNADIFKVQGLIKEMRETETEQRYKILQTAHINDADSGNILLRRILICFSFIAIAFYKREAGFAVVLLMGISVLYLRFFRNRNSRLNVWAEDISFAGWMAVCLMYFYIRWISG